ncbi:hypothetical protein D3C81_1604150 [compost metagenome]
MNVLQIALMILNMAGIVWALVKHKFSRLLPLLLALAYFTVIYVPFVAFNRYGYPNMVLLILFGSYLIDQLLTGLNIGRWGRIDKGGHLQDEKL